MTAKDPKIAKPENEPPSEEMQVEKSALDIIKGTENDVGYGLFLLDIIGPWREYELNDALFMAMISWRFWFY